MTLPNLKKFFFCLLIAVFLFVSSPLATLAATTASPPNEQPNAAFDLTPIPLPSGDEKVAPLPKPSTSSATIQQASIFGDIVDGFKGIIDGIKSIGSFFINCVTDPAECAGDVAKAIAQTGKFFLAVVMSTFGEMAFGEKFGQTLKVIANHFVSGDYNVSFGKLKEIAEDNSSYASSGLAGMESLAFTSITSLSAPISTKEYFASINPFKTARADGYGDLKDCCGNVLMKVWTNVRNLSYSLAIVVLVILGFMVMFRFPLGPRNAVTIQNSLPRIVIALILITFSFAIAGLLVDLTRIVISLALSLVDAGGSTPIFSLVYLFEGLAAVFLIGVGTSFLGGVGVIIGLAALAFMVIMALILIIVFAVIIYKLLVRYVTFILLAIFSPLVFLIAAVPGREELMATWFKRCLASLLAIPATLLVVQLSFAIGFSTFSLSSFDTPVPIFPNLGPLSWISVAPIIGVGLFFFATKVPDLVDQFFNIKPGPKGGLGVGSIIGAPLAGLYAAGNIQKARSGVQGMAADYIGSKGIMGGLARGVARAPFLGNKDLRDRMAEDKAAKGRVAARGIREVSDISGFGAKNNEAWEQTVRSDNIISKAKSAGRDPEAKRQEDIDKTGGGRV